jgi:hypothetical protein
LAWSTQRDAVDRILELSAPITKIVDTKHCMVTAMQALALPENRNRGSEVIAIHTRVGVSGSSEACHHQIPAPSSLGLSQCLALLHLPPFMPQQQTV